MNAWWSMKHHPLLQPDSPNVPPPWDKKSLGQEGDPLFAENHIDVTQLARTLAAHGGGAASLDLALDLVLNEVVDEARRATEATGAAIALARAGEMVCRASSGADAPQLGDRVETMSGLSGACLQTGTVQQCADTETDPRVNAEACRHLGVRSILIIPLVDGREPFGILEVFSARPNAFGERDIGILQFLGRRVIENRRVTEKGAAILTGPDDRSHAPARERQIPADLGSISEPDTRSSSEEGSPKRTDTWTSMLSVLVIVMAVLLGLMIGWRGAVRGLRGGSHQQSGASSTASANQTARPTEGQAAATPGANLAPSSTAGSVSQPGTSRALKATEPPSGGLIVTQNGKVIFRLPPSEPPATGAAPVQQGPPGPAASQSATGVTSARATEEVSGEDATARLIHRVEPEYPAEARTQHIQGTVVLDVQIGGDGTVRNIAAVSGDPVLTEAATKAVKQWRYQPYSIDGNPVEMQTRITIKFTLPPS